MKISSQIGNNWSPKSENETEPTAQTSEETPERMCPSVSLGGLFFFVALITVVLFALFCFCLLSLKSPHICCCCYLIIAIFRLESAYF